MRHHNAVPRTRRQAEARERALSALAVMRREGLSLSTAAASERTDPRTVVRYVGSAIRRDRTHGRYHATLRDRIARTLHVITPGGTQPVTVRSSRTASRIAEYMNAVRTYVNSGDSSALARFAGRRFRTNLGTLGFVTDTATLDHLGDASELEIEGLYRASYGMGA